MHLSLTWTHVAMAIDDRSLEGKHEKKTGCLFFCALVGPTDLSNEKKAPGCLGYIGDDLLPGYIGINNKPLYQVRWPSLIGVVVPSSEANDEQLREGV